MAGEGGCGGWTPTGKQITPHCKRQGKKLGGRVSTPLGPDSCECIHYDIVSFYRAMLCKRGLFCNAVSVCLSVTFVDRVKMNKHIFEIFSPSGSDTILVFHTKGGADIPTGTPLTGASNATGYDKMTIFSQISRCISERVIVRWAHAPRQFVSMEFSVHPYNI